ncbi:MAG: permease-like cell division protein FtsX [Alloprevotella sp.]|nr:permease-like cell division protein FtsX [Alloprevotella sp.]
MAKKRKNRAGHFTAVTSCISTSMVLILLGAVVFSTLMAYNFGHNVREHFSIEVVVADSASQQDLYALQQNLRAKPYTLRTRYVSREKSNAEMAEALADSEFAEWSPIPAEFEVFLRADYACMDSLRLLVPALQKQKDVADVIFPKDALETLDNTIPVTSIVLLVVAILLAIISSSLIHNIVRLSIHSRRHDILTMKLVGAKWSYIRKPFLQRSAIIGLIAALIAGGLLLTGILYLLHKDIYISQLITPLVITATLCTVFVVGLLLTLISTTLSVNRFLRMTEGELILR